MSHLNLDFVPMSATDSDADAPTKCPRGCGGPVFESDCGEYFYCGGLCDWSSRDEDAS